LEETEKEIFVPRNKFITVVVFTAMLGALSSTFAAEHHERGGHVMACSLHGVNPVHHPAIFGDPAVAKSYGFVQTSDGKWVVEKNCRRHPRAT